MSLPKILIGALSCRQHADRRQACLETWAADVDAWQSLDLVFLIGEPTLPAPQREGRLLYLPCPDDYDSLPQKTAAYCRWAVANCGFDYLLKCDDDTYLHLERLVNFSSELQGDYIGHALKGYASGGAGYLISRWAAHIVAHEVQAQIGYEDVEVGQALAAHGIRLTHANRFNPWPWHWRTPRPGNDLVSGHGWSPAQLRTIHSRFHTR